IERLSPITYPVVEVDYRVTPRRPWHLGAGGGAVHSIRSGQSDPCGPRLLITLFSRASTISAATTSPSGALSIPVRSRDITEQTPGLVRNTGEPCDRAAGTERRNPRTSPSPTPMDGARRMLLRHDWRPSPGFGQRETPVRRQRDRPCPGSKLLRSAAWVVLRL